MKTKTFYNIVYLITIIFFITLIYYFLYNNKYNNISYEEQDIDIKDTDDNIKKINKIQIKEKKELLEELNSYDNKELKYNNTNNNDNIELQDNSIYIDNDNYVNELMKNKKKNLNTLETLDKQFYNFRKTVPIDKCKYNYNISKDQKTDLPISNVPYKFLFNKQTMKLSDNI